MKKTITQIDLLKVLGKPYEHGSYGPDSFYCYGLVWFCYKEFFGLDLPKYQGNEQPLLRRFKKIRYLMGENTWKRNKEINHGDVVIFGKYKNFDHVAIAIDSKRILHVSSRFNSVSIDRISNLANYYNSILSYSYAS